jgi:hypothetical protein
MKSKIKSNFFLFSNLFNLKYNLTWACLILPPPKNIRHISLVKNQTILSLAKYLWKKYEHLQYWIYIHIEKIYFMENLLILIYYSRCSIFFCINLVDVRRCWLLTKLICIIFWDGGSIYFWVYDMVASKYKLTNNLLERKDHRENIVLKFSTPIHIGTLHLMWPSRRSEVGKPWVFTQLVVFLC